MPRSALLSLTLLTLAACGDVAGDERNDAQLLIERLAALEALDDGQFERRAQLVEDLRRLPVRGERLTSLRDTCANLYGSLLAAEQATARARAAIPPEGATEHAENEAAQQMAAALAASQAAIERVEMSQRECVDGAAQLRARYAPRR